MEAIRIISYRAGMIFSSNAIFILSKGLNAGKPLAKPCPNCFAVEFRTLEDVERFKSLCLVLLQMKIFGQHLRGSVIPFLTISDFRKIIQEYEPLFSHHPDDFLSLIHKLHQIETEEQKNRRMLSLLADLRKSLIYEYIKERR